VNSGRGTLLKQVHAAQESQESRIGQTDITRSLTSDPDQNSASDPAQVYIYFMWSDTLPSARYILSDDSSIPFYVTSERVNAEISETTGATILGLGCRFLRFLRGLWAFELAWHIRITNLRGIFA